MFAPKNKPTTQCSTEGKVICYVLKPSKIWSQSQQESISRFVRHKKINRVTKECVYIGIHSDVHHKKKLKHVRIQKVFILVHFFFVLEVSFELKLTCTMKKKHINYCENNVDSQCYHNTLKWLKISLGLFVICMQSRFCNMLHGLRSLAHTLAFVCFYFFLHIFLHLYSLLHVITAAFFQCKRHFVCILNEHIE